MSDGSNDDLYYAVGTNALKLKGTKDIGMKKKKKKKNKQEKELSATIKSSLEDDRINELVTASVSSQKGYSAHRTKAEMHFIDRQRQLEEIRIKKKASKSHKEKVEEFNRNLDSQSEHFDIPKVSWTK